MSLQRAFRDYGIQPNVCYPMSVTNLSLVAGAL